MFLLLVIHSSLETTLSFILPKKKKIRFVSKCSLKVEKKTFETSLTFFVKKKGPTV